jgi:hypothetical protein
MIICDATSKKLQVVLYAAPSAEFPWVVSWVDMQYISAGGTRKVFSAVLQVGDQLIYTDRTGFYVADLSGQLKQSSVSADPRLLSFVEQTDSQRVLASPINPGGASLVITSGTAYFVYLGRVVQACTPLYVELYLAVVGAGAQTFEVGLFSTPNPPMNAGQTLTKITSTATYDNMTSGLGPKRNTGAAFNTSIPAGTHLWAGCRAAMATTQPGIWSLRNDMGQVAIFSLAAAGTFAATASFAGALIAGGTAATPPAQCPDLRVTLN